MRILLVSPFGLHAARGNSVAAVRLADGFGARGHDVRAVESQGLDKDCAADAIIAAGPVDVALILHAAHGATAAQVLRERGIPYVISLRGTDANEMLADPVRGPAVLNTLGGAAGIAVFHDAMREQLVAGVPSVANRVRVVPNGLSIPSSCVDYRRQFGLEAEDFVFVSLAGLREVKRPLFPIEQLAPQTREFPRLRFVRAGPVLEKPLAEAMRALTTAHRWVLDAGEIPHETVDSFLRTADVFVSASRSEGMPHAVREAMLTGRTLLLSDIPGHRVMAEPERDALFFADAASFKTAARRLLTDSGLRQRLGEAARKRVESELAAHDEIGENLALLDACRRRT